MKTTTTPQTLHTESIDMHVTSVWSTPNGEDLIIKMARVSAPENEDKPGDKLLAYLIKHGHWSPFEMVNLCVEIHTTRDIARQLLRHRSFSFQEFSQRYATVDKLPASPLRETRLQDSKNRQSSLPNADSQLDQSWRAWQEEVRIQANSAYNWAIKHGIAKEVARAVLPEGLTMSRMYMNGTLRSWLHFLQLRKGNGTQKETQEVATLISKEVERLFPVSYKALLENV